MCEWPCLVCQPPVPFSLSTGLPCMQTKYFICSCCGRRLKNKRKRSPSSCPCWQCCGLLARHQCGVISAWHALSTNKSGLLPVVVLRVPVHMCVRLFAWGWAACSVALHVCVRVLHVCISTWTASHSVCLVKGLLRAFGRRVDDVASHALV